ncbi:peripheral-type benzodiazepine receptor-associated protein 1-like isoform X4 [Biomphalaria glabrata]|uniref:Peripheral-type benzodiazepine receptor-associated protein 1-like isoform X4 n=1 Tax=Biomphalaria glabrata TaxID=6526 RepID=A0A9W2YGQ4_BIOGL|nr:peripheral-type benzodiazepine receptor-associated protein 1-like isoform X4 [Biomphalaria glabrata]
MEYSPLYTRRLSGSYSSRNSFNEDALEQLEFNINDISRASSPASVISISARSEGFRERRHRGSGRYDDEYRKKYSIMRGELEVEKNKSRQLQQEKEEELRKLRDTLENERRMAMIAMQNRLEEEQKKELNKLKEELIKQKDFELQQVLLYRETEKKLRHSHKSGENRRGAKEEETKTMEKERVGVDEEEDEQIGLKDGDNDVAVVSEKGRTKDGSREERRKLKQGIEKQLMEEESKSADVGLKDGTVSAEHRRTPRTPRTHRISDGYLADKESGTTHRSRRAHGISSRATTDKPDKKELSEVTEAPNTFSEAVKDTNSNKLPASTIDSPLPNKDVVTDSKESNLPIGSQPGYTVSSHQLPHPPKELIDNSTNTTETPIEDSRDQEAEKSSELELRLQSLEMEKKTLQKQRDEYQRHLETKTRECKIRDEEFKRVKEGYEINLRTVINEHKKVALVNLEKLKQAETALKASTMSDDEIAMISREHTHRRLSLPGLEDESRKEDREKEKVLQKKVTDLTTQIQRLERRVTLLRSENDSLKRKQEDQKPLEEKIKSLKKRNAELASIARRLEEKAKLLQQENTKVRPKTTITNSADENNLEAEHLKRLFARQRAKDLAEHAKSMLTKDKEIEELRRKCQELADQLSNGDLLVPLNAAQFEEKDELVNIIKQAAKERLQLEQQLSHTKTTTRSPTSEDVERQSSNEKYSQELKAANQILHNEIEKLESALRRAEHLEQQLTEKSTQCQSLTKDLAASRLQCEQLQSDLATATSEKHRLDGEVRELRGKLQSLDKITEECNTLKLSLATAQKEREAAQEQVQHLNLRVHSLENLVRDLQESAESVGRIENECKIALSNLQQKEAELDKLHKVNSSLESEHFEVVSKLNQHVQQLEDKKSKEEKRREELSKEVQRLQKEVAERQRAIEEADRLKEELIQLKKQSPVLSEVPVLASHSTSSLLSNSKGNHLDLEKEEEDLDLTIVEEGMDKKSLQLNEHGNSESLLSAWANKGPIQVYMAKYNYYPFEYSPNENPEAELPLNAGDYVLVVGEMDEDGFFDGELIDGRQGLVPSNFIEKVEDDDLSEFHDALLQAGHGDYSSAGTPGVATAMSPSPLTPGSTKINNNNNEMSFSLTSSQKRDVQNGNNPEEVNSDLEDIAEIDEETASINSRTLPSGGSAINNLPPSPRGLSLDKQLTNSILISWKEPEPVPGLDVQSYHIFVDGHFKTSVNGRDRTKALLEGISSSTNHRVCVRCLSNKGQSKDAQCTMVIGKDVYPVPSELKVSHVSPTSASLSWLPGDSNYQHSIVLNGKEVRVVKPGVFRHTLTGLIPGSLQKVTLIAKSISGTLIEEKSRKWVDNVSASIEFHTPQTGAPEPPLNVQVESGPREGTILLTWLPVTINSSGVCNGAVVGGYQVCGDNRKIKTVPGPTSDHAVLSAEDFKGIYPSHLSVRTVSRSGVESVNSDLITLPIVLINELKEGRASPQVVDIAQRVSSRGKSSKSQADDGRAHDTDEEIEAAFRENEKTSPQPAPRKLVAENLDLRPKEFNDKKAKGALISPSRVVPAIEITRDSSTEQFTEIDEDGSATSTGNTPMSSPGQPTANTSILSHYWGDTQSPSAFRHVDQTRRHEGGEKGRPEGESPDAVLGGTQNIVPSSSSVNRSGSQPMSRTHSQEAKVHSESPSTRQTLRSGSSQDSDHRKHSNPGVEDVGDTDSISGEINTVVDENTIRLFIALFDYDPATMSPNVDSIDEELPFREGQILKVFGDKDADGFYRGESHGKKGFIPCNMVSEVQIDDPDLVEQLLKETSERPVPDSTLHSNRDVDLTPNGRISLPREEPMKRMIALYDYDPQELSPNVDAELELSFKTGDIVLIYGDMDEDGFYTGVVNGQQGLVPSNFLQPAPLSDDEGLESVSVVSATRSRSGESLDAALSALGRTDVTANTPRLSDPLASRSESTGSSKQVTNVNAPEGNKSADNSRPGTASPAEEEKPKKKGFLNKSKNIFKKFTR